MEDEADLKAIAKAAEQARARLEAARGSLEQASEPSEAKDSNFAELKQSIIKGAVRRDLSAGRAGHTRRPSRTSGAGGRGLRSHGNQTLGLGAAALVQAFVPRAGGLAGRALEALPTAEKPEHLPTTDEPAAALPDAADGASSRPITMLGQIRHRPRPGEQRNQSATTPEADGTDAVPDGETSGWGTLKARRSRRAGSGRDAPADPRPGGGQLRGVKSRTLLRPTRPRWTCPGRFGLDDRTATATDKE